MTQQPHGSRNGLAIGVTIGAGIVVIAVIGVFIAALVIGAGDEQSSASTGTDESQFAAVHANDLVIGPDDLGVSREDLELNRPVEGHPTDVEPLRNEAESSWESVGPEPCRDLWDLFLLVPSGVTSDYVYSRQSEYSWGPDARHYLWTLAVVTPSADDARTLMDEVTDAAEVCPRIDFGRDEYQHAVSTIDDLDLDHLVVHERPTDARDPSSAATVYLRFGNAVVTTYILDAHDEPDVTTIAEAVIANVEGVG